MYAPSRTRSLLGRFGPSPSSSTTACLLKLTRHGTAWQCARVTSPPTSPMNNCLTGVNPESTVLNSLLYHTRSAAS